MGKLKQLTKEQLEELLKTKNINQIAKMHGVRFTQVTRQMISLGIEVPHKLQYRYRFLAKYTKEDLQKMYNEAKSVVKLGEQLNVPAANLYDYFKKIGVEVIPGLAVTGQESWCKGLTKETDSRVAAIATKLTGIVRGEEYKKNMSTVMKESAAHAEGMKVQAEKLRGIPLSAEHIAKISASLLGKPKNWSPDGKQRIRAAAIKRLLERFANKGNPTTTDIEQLLQDELTLRNIPFVAQINILDTTIPDVFIEPNICVYADGDYFHLKSRVALRDTSLNKFLANRNYKVFRFWGSDIKKDVKKCVDEIENYIKNLTIN